MKRTRRNLTAKEKRWQRAVLDLEFCTLCGRFGVQWAHRNQGKGMGLKVSPDQTAALCPPCHHEIDNGRDMLRDERRALMDKAISRTRELLIQRGTLPV